MQAVTAPPGQTDSGHRVRTILGRPGFRRLLAVRLPSHFADGLFQAALGGSVFFSPEKAASAMGVAIAFAVLYLPYSAIGPFVGVFLDRWSRRQILYLANATRAVAVLPVAYLIWRGENGLPFILLALLVVGINRLFLNGLSASLPHVVEPPQLVTANSFATTMGTIVYSAGLGSCTALFHATKPSFHLYAIICAASGIGYALSATCARTLFDKPALGPDAAQRPPHGIWAGMVDTARGMVAGLGHIRRQPVARTLMLVQAIHRTLYGLLFIATLLLYRHYFHRDDDVSGTLAGLGVMLVVGASGVLLGAFLTPRISRSIGGWRWITVLMATLAVIIPVFGLPFTAPMLLVAVFMVNAATQATKIVVDSALQLECDDDYQGRVFSVNDTAFNLSLVTGIFVGALVLPYDGHSTAVVGFVGLAYAVVAVWLAFSGSRPRSRRADVS